MNNDIKIYVSCHKDSYIPDNENIIPIQVGAELTSKRLDKMICDNTGENISNKNKSYCELTAQYWAWKNSDSEYCGFFHYRRYLSFKQEYYTTQNNYNVKPYITLNKLNDKSLQEISFDENSMRSIIKKYDVVAPLKERNNCSVYDQYKISEFHKIEDLDTVIEIINEKYPEYVDSMNKYLNSHDMYYCNMFIMKRNIFNDYCKWLFDILNEHEKRRNLYDYSVDEYRVSGFLGERLFGIYYTKIKQEGRYSCCELQKVEFKDTEPDVVVNPVFNDDYIPIVLSANDDFTPYLGVMIQSIIDNSSLNIQYDIIILHKDISNDRQWLIQKMIKNMKNFSIRFCNTYYLINNMNFFVDKHLSEETYYRLLIQDILRSYNKVLYLDCDMVVNYDVSELFKTNIEGYLIAAVRDIDYAGVYKKSMERREYTEKILKLENPYNYFQAGVLVLNLDEFRKNFTVEELINVAISYKWKHHDQDVLNYLCKNKVKYLDMSWNVVMNWKNNFSCRMDVLKLAPRMLYNEYLNSRNNPKIIHFAGYQKPWDEFECDYSEEFWKYARKTYFYEAILKRMILGKSNVKRKAKLGENAIKIKGIGKTIFIDMRKINELFPPGSKRRIIVKNLARLIYK